MNKKNMRSFLTLNKIKYLFYKWENYICLVLSVLFVIQVYSSISNFELKTVYAMENIYTCKTTGLRYAKIKLDLDSLKSYCLENTQICDNRFNDLLGKNNLDIMGLFKKEHMFFLHNNMYNKEVLSSLTHSPSFSRGNSIIENILISEKDYMNWCIENIKNNRLISEKSNLDWNISENKPKKSQYLGDFLDYKENEPFFEIKSLTKGEQDQFKSYYKAHESTIDAGLKQQCQKRVIILFDEIKRASGDIDKSKIKQ